MARLELDGNRNPRPVLDSRCLDCGHCVAVCLAGAISQGEDEAPVLPNSQALGAGTCWAGFVFIGVGVSPELHAVLGLPAGQPCAGIMMAGRPAVSYRRVPRRNQPRIDWRG